MGLLDELDLVFEAAHSVNYGRQRTPAPAISSTNQRRAVGPTGSHCVCVSCGSESVKEHLLVYRPDEATIYRTQITCKGRPACSVVIQDSDRPPTLKPKPNKGDTIMNAMPKCACGCGETVKAPGRKLASRQCIGAYNATKRQPQDLTESGQLLEEAIRLVSSLPRGSRAQFLQKVVELVNTAEELTSEF